MTFVNPGRTPLLIDSNIHGIVNLFPKMRSDLWSWTEIILPVSYKNGKKIFHSDGFKLHKYDTVETLLHLDASVLV